MQYDKNANTLGHVLEKLVYELGFSSLNQLWDEAGETANRATWYRRVDPKSKLRTGEKQITKLIRGLERNSHALSREQKDMLYTAVGVKIIRQEENPDRYIRLEALKDPDRQHLLDARLANFVSGTRQMEASEIIKRIDRLLSTGGYQAITGQAGEGKTTLIAQLIANHFGREKTAYHFIPFNPGHDHQVTMLHSLMACLALKHQYLPDVWTHIFHRDTLAGIFANMLAEISAHGEQEVVFIDGLDQIRPEVSMGERDLYFLPPHLPRGIVIVVGTRPDDTLKPLKLLVPFDEYKLPRLSRGDFDLVLASYGLQLKEDVAGQLYEATQNNALYIDLVAKELARKGEITPEDIIKRVSHNPENIFSLSVDRLKWPKSEWRGVVKPILGLLLAVREPLSARAIGQILRVEDDALGDGVQRLGGLVVSDGKGRYYLYHLKLQEYLREDKSNASKEYVISSEEESDWHRQLANWCTRSGEADIVTMWQDAGDTVEQERRLYAQQYYITHLFQARAWERLFEVLDAGTYGGAKMRSDRSLRSYVQDLDIGREAASWQGWTMDEGITLLPSLWRYSLLRCTLVSRADTYTPAAFEALLLLGRDQEAVGLAEILTKPEYQVEMLLLLSGYFAEQPAREQETIQLLLRCREAANSIKKQDERASALCRVGARLVRLRRLQQAKMVLAEAEVAAANARNDIDRARALETLTLTLARGQLWEQARKVVQTIGVGWVKADTLSYLGSLLAEEQQWEQADAVWAEAEAEIGSVEGEEDKAEAFYELAILYIEAKQWERIEALLFKMERSWQRDYARLELGLALAEEQQWQRAEQLVRTIEDDQIKADALSQLGIVLRKARHQEQAGALLIEAEAIIRTVRENNENSNDVLRTQGEVLIRAQRWEEANALIRIMDESNERIWLLRDLSEAFVRTQQWERIGDVVQMIERSEKNEERTDALSRVAIAFAELGQWERAEAVVHLMEASRERAKALLDLGTALAKAQQMERAKSLWVEVLNLVPAAEDYSERAEISQDLGMIFAKAQHGEQAQKFWAEAVRMASMIEDNQEKSYTLCKIGATLNAAQRREQAEAMWREAEAAAYALDMQEDRDQALWVLSITLSYAQQWEKAGPIAHAIAENAKRADALYTLSTALAHAEQDEKAEAILAEWLSVVNSLERDEAIYKIWKEVVRAGLWDRAKAMIDLMENTWRKERLRGELGEALAYEQQWEQAEAVIAEMEKGKQRVEALCVLGTALALAQQLERAESKWAEAEAIADMIENGWEKESSLPHIGRALAQAHLWERAEAAANRLEESRDRANIMCEIQQALNYAGERERNLRLIQRSWQQAKTKEYLLKLLPLAYKFVIRDTEIGKAFYEAFLWVDSTLMGAR